MTEAIAGFDKATLINCGIAQSTAERVLISDADILWNAEAIADLQAALQPEIEGIVYVQTVHESVPQTQALHRPRYRYQLHWQGDRVTIAIEPVCSQAELQRPGCGLVYAHRRTLLTLGGYKTCFQGWGWEDQDLLMRAELLGLPIMAAGTVAHLSHSDRCRNQFYPNVAITQSRDRNILTCLHQLQAGQFWGDLASHLAVSGGNLPDDVLLSSSQYRPPINIQIKLPEGLLA